MPVGAIREHSGPGDGETIVGHLQLLQDLNVFVDPVVTVTSSVSIVIVAHSQRSVGELIPDTQTLSISSPIPFNLPHQTKQRLVGNLACSLEGRDRGCLGLVR